MGSISVSPKVHYSNRTRGIIAMEYIENHLQSGRDPKILNTIPGSTKSLMKLIRDVHKYEVLNNNLSHRVALDYVKKNAEQIPAGFLSKTDAEILTRIVKTPWPKGKQVLTHNDFRSGNVLYDGERFWLIDWDLGGLGHPHYDIAYFSNYQALSPKDGGKLFSQYLEREPTSEELKVFNNLRRIAFGFSATLALPALAKIGNTIKAPRKKEPSISSLAQLWQRIDDGSLDINIPRDEYRISIFLLGESAKY